MDSAKEVKLTASDRKALEALAEANDQLSVYLEIVDVANVTVAEQKLEYPEPNWDSPLKLVIGNSR